MKSREGFVSNSSTSSYIIIIPDENFEEVISELTEIQQKIVKELVNDEEVIGIKAKVLSYMSGNISSFEDWEFSDELQKELEANEIEDEPYETADEFGELVKKHPKGYCHSVDC